MATAKLILCDGNDPQWRSIGGPHPHSVKIGVWRNDVAVEGLETWAKQIDGDIDLGCIYGGGPFSAPGAHFDKLFAALQCGNLRGIVGIYFTEASVTDWSAEVRGAAGAVLRMAPKVFVADKFSIEWAKHYCLDARLGELLNWLAQPGAELYRWPSTSNVEDLVSASLHGKPILLDVTVTGGTMQNGRPATYAPLVRFAAKYGCEHLLCHTSKELEEKHELLKAGKLLPVSPDIVERAKAAAANMLEQVFEPKKRLRATSLLAKADQLFGPAQPDEEPEVTVENDLRPRRLEIGTVFDPATHYTAHYYDGRGLLYKDNEDHWQLYHGPSTTWEGNRLVVEIMQAITGGLTKGTHRDGGQSALLDLGCSAGDFVHKARQADVRAYGVDISADAYAKAHPDVKPYILISDLCQPSEELADHAQYRVTTAWDFWEHIYEEQIDALINAMRELMPVGGLHFAIICTRGRGETDWTIKPGTTFSKENSWLLCSGHVTIRRWNWWAQKFVSLGFAVRHDLHALFQVARAEDPGFRQSESWSARNLLVLEKI